MTIFLNTNQFKNLNGLYKLLVFFLLMCSLRFLWQTILFDLFVLIRDILGAGINFQQPQVFTTGYDLATLGTKFHIQPLGGISVLIFSDQFAFVLSAIGKAFKSLNCARVQYRLLL